MATAEVMGTATPPAAAAKGSLARAAAAAAAAMPKAGGRTVVIRWKYVTLFLCAFVVVDKLVPFLLSSTDSLDSPPPVASLLRADLGLDLVDLELLLGTGPGGVLPGSGPLGAEETAKKEEEVAKQLEEEDEEEGRLALAERRRFGRRLSESSSDGTKSSAAGSSDGHSAASEDSHENEGHGNHSQHGGQAMFFLIAAIMWGTLMLHISTLPRFHSMQQTVVLFILGMLTSFILVGLELNEVMLFGRSHQMWLDIDPHLLLFTLLPPLLAGDAMTIDTSVAQKVALQCLFLAGPGVAINAGLTAGFLQLLLPHWNFMLCLTTGSILCATDPVAVVALLKELGASPTLTVQIQGESLLNDGTAIVVFTIAYDLVQGGEFVPVDVIVFLVKTAVYAVVVGMTIGVIFYFWIKLVNDKMDHSSALIQVSLTIACAYTSFCVAEGLLHVSGVLSTVAASLVLAHEMWPEIVSAETTHTIWHMFEYLGNTIIFYLAGAITGASMIEDATWEDWGFLFAIYFALIVIRSGMIFCSIPLLTWLHRDKQPVTWRDAVVMSWGGLRGAVGLALAIQVAANKGNNVEPRDAHRVLFYVGGVAALTLLINATTCPLVVKMLGITEVPKAKQKLMLLVQRRLKEQVEDGKHLLAVKEAVLTVLESLKHHIDPHDEIDDDMHDAAETEKKNHIIDTMRFGVASSQPSRQDVGGVGDAASPTSSKPVAGAGGDVDCGASSASTIGTVSKAGENKPSEDACSSTASPRAKHWQKLKHRALRWNRRLAGHKNTLQGRTILDYEAALERYWKSVVRFRERFHDIVPACLVEEKAPKILRILRASLNSNIQLTLTRTITESFLHMLWSNYQSQMDYDLPFKAGEVLVASIQHSLSVPADCVRDFECIRKSVGYERDCVKNTASQRKWFKRFTVARNAPSPAPATVKSASAAARQEAEEDDFLAVSPEMRRIASTKAPLMGPKIVGNLVESAGFTLFIMIMITLNSVWVYAESEMKDTSSAAFVIVECVFTAIFTLECLLKVTAYRAGYFQNSWNLFDLLLVIIGLIGVILKLTLKDAAAVGRSLKVFMILRSLRQIRLIKLVQVVAEQLRPKDKHSRRSALEVLKFNVLVGYIRAHVECQQQMVDFFGRRGDADVVEVGLCVIQSQTFVVQAMHIANDVADELNGDWRLEETQLCERNLREAGVLERIIIEAQRMGVLNGKEAEEIIDTMHHHTKMYQDHINTIFSGRAVKPQYCAAESFSTTDVSGSGSSGFSPLGNLSPASPSRAASSRSTPPPPTETSDTATAAAAEAASSRSASDDILQKKSSSRGVVNEMSGDPKKRNKDTE